MGDDRVRIDGRASWLCSRRDILIAAGTLPLLAAGCRHDKPAPSGLRYADAHLHLFNAHDLPVGPFLVDVVFRERDMPRELKAVIDYLVSAVAQWAVSAVDERRRLEGAALVRDDAADFTPELFARDFVSRAREGAYRVPPPPWLRTNRAELRAGYEALLQAVVADSSGGSAEAVAPEPGASLTAPSAAPVVERSLADLARRAESGMGPAPGENLVDAADPSPRPRCDAVACPERPLDLSIAAILRYLGWAYLMLRSREHHLVYYLRRAARHGERPGTILNHLVDYDDWLGEERLTGSSHVDQVEVAHALAARYGGGGGGRPPVDVKTFAPFCPLKHAREMRQFGRAPTFEALLRQAREGKVAGFKLYPPMGFQPCGNSALPNEDFDPHSNVRAEHFRAWSRELGATPGGCEIGIALDASLDTFYAACQRENLPVMAHSSPGNQAGPDFGQRANPRHWLAVAAKYPLRVSLGHLVHSARDFVCAERAGGTPPDCVWALHAAPTLLDPRSTPCATFYGDLGFMPELIEDPTLAIAFFQALARVFGRADPKLTRIVYGSDYIMLGKEKDYGNHLSAMRAAMAAARYDKRVITNILERNALRFLGGGSETGGSSPRARCVEGNRPVQCRPRRDP